MDAACILVVDDDKEIAKAIEKLFLLEGFQVKLAFDGRQAIEAINSEKIQLIIMDVMMPKMDGLSATLKIRENKNIPIIILSAKSEDSDKILGLSMGADDYVTKPFNPAELVARAKSQLRRYMQLGDMRNTMDNNTITIGNLQLVKDAKAILVDGDNKKLTLTEYKIVELLMTNAGVVFSAEQIYEKIWDEPAYSVENTVMVHIRRIREKIEIIPKEPKYLKVVWGIGYKIEKID